MIFKIVNPDTLLIEHSYEADEAVQYGGSWGSYPHLPVEALDPDCVKAELVEDVITLIEDTDKTATKAVATKTSLVTTAYNELNADVYAQMAVVFGTTNADSAVANNESYKNMKSSPALFSNKGFKAEKAVGSFTLGAALDTDQKVIDYASARLGETTQYAVWRMERIEQFKAERNTILNG
jgi:hypothetical protein